MSVPMDVRQEMRFAVIMYGGVSLATYIHGVTMELARMVRATAPDPDNPDRALLGWEELGPSERVYRRLGQLLDGSPAGGRRPVADDAPIMTRFVVDILSGTSAGGINAVYLAKALANGQSLASLERLWLEEGDIARLINDKESVKDLPGGPGSVRDTRALLNGDRMYQILLSALDGMDSEPTSSTEALVKEVDLFVTATDIHGLPVQLSVDYGHASERRYRTVLRFQFRDEPGDERNDFVAANNVLLAFAARASSSFPFAFEPARLVDVDRVLERMPDRTADEGSRNEAWARFFPDYSGSGARDYRQRSFGDGGYLDNKPFSHAIDALTLHPTGIPVDRKLLYVEPKPLDVQSRSSEVEPPDALDNVMSALTLPRHESIHEDLQRVTERNRTIRIVEQLLSGLEQDVWRQRPEGMAATDYVQKCRRTWQDYLESDRRALQKEFGVPFAGYERLEVAVAAEDLATWIARAAGIDESSPRFRALISLVTAWREIAYPDEPAEETQRSLRSFLFHFNLRYRLRRLDFVLGRIDRLQVDDDYRAQMLSIHGEDPRAITEDFRSEFVAALRRTRHGLADSRKMRTETRQALEHPSPDHWIRAAVAPFAAVTDRLDAILEHATIDDQLAAAKREVEDFYRGPLDHVEGVLIAKLGELGSAAALVDKAARAESATATDAERKAHEIVEGFWAMYTYYDVVIFPILQSTGVGEHIAQVDVVRVSPVDAPSLIDERRETRRKLAGTSLMNFGGFVERSWRWNDVLWGQLDALERLATVCLPSGSDRELRARLVEEGHTGLVAAMVTRATEAQSVADGLAAAAEDPQRSGSPAKSAGDEFATPVFPVQDLYRYLKEDYEVDRRPEPARAMRSLARATHVVGQMLELASAERGVSGRPARWLTRIGRWSWGLVEMAVPQSMPNLLARHWIRLAYLAAAVLLVIGVLLSDAGMVRSGMVFGGAAIFVRLTLLFVADVMRNGVSRPLLKALVGAVGLGLVMLGLWHVPDLVNRVSSWLYSVLDRLR